MSCVSSQFSLFHSSGPNPLFPNMSTRKIWISDARVCFLGQLPVSSAGRGRRGFQGGAAEAAEHRAPEAGGRRESGFGTCRGFLNKRGSPNQAVGGLPHDWTHDINQAHDIGPPSCRFASSVIADFSAEELTASIMFCKVFQIPHHCSVCFSCGLIVVFLPEERHAKWRCASRRAS